MKRNNKEKLLCKEFYILRGLGRQGFGLGGCETKSKDGSNTSISSKSTKASTNAATQNDAQSI